MGKIAVINIFFPNLKKTEIRIIPYTMILIHYA